MLILKRKPGESIVVGENIRISFLEIKGRQVWIGVEAPRDVPIRREEIPRPTQPDESDSPPSPPPAESP